MTEGGQGEGEAHAEALHLRDEDKHDRYLKRQEWRKPLYTIPTGELFELPGRPNVCYQVRNYAELGPKLGAEEARQDILFLFKAFETGQKSPARLAKKYGESRQPTIHEYLDWTVTASPPQDADDFDFGGFRTIVLFSRCRPQWPPPDVYSKGMPNAFYHKTGMELGCPKDALPQMLPNGRPVCAATIRCGADYLEVPFFASADNHRGKGYGRCLLEAIEQVGRALKMKRILLCSTDDPKVRGTWAHFGFEFTTSEQLAQWQVYKGDLMYMTNTVQMHKNFPVPRPFRSILVKHDHYRQRLYFPTDAEKGVGLKVLHDAEAAAEKKARRAPNKGVVKKVVKKVAKQVIATGRIATAALAATAAATQQGQIAQRAGGAAVHGS